MRLLQSRKCTGMQFWIPTSAFVIGRAMPDPIRNRQRVVVHKNCWSSTAFANECRAIAIGPRPDRFCNLDRHHRAMRKGVGEMSWKIQLIAALLLPVIVLFGLAVISPSLAHDHNRPELNDWFKTLHSGKGLCCDGSDATSLEDPDWE